MSTQTITRHQLCQIGLTPYQARVLTQGISPQATVAGSYVYLLSDVITAVRSHLTRPRLRPASQVAFQAALVRLLEQLDNVISGPFGLSREEQIGFYVHKILKRPQGSEDTSLGSLTAR